MEPFKMIEFAKAVRESTLKRLRIVPSGFENWRISNNSLSFADIAKHLIDTDNWLFQKLKNHSLESIRADAGSFIVKNRQEYLDLLQNLFQTGKERENLIERIKNEDWNRRIYDDRFNGEISVWWLIVRGNLDHEIHHRGQLASYLRVLKDKKLL
jgi:uncharacterized damage-inducible protein DinB